MPDFVKTPGAFKEENNRSAKRNMDFVRYKVKECEEQGHVKKVTFSSCTQTTIKTHSNNPHFFMDPVGLSFKHNICICIFL